MVRHEADSCWARAWLRGCCVTPVVLMAPVESAATRDVTAAQGRAGYLRWREDLKRFHAATVAGLMQGAGYPPDSIAKVLHCCILAYTGMIGHRAAELPVRVT
jgi:chloramphenicol 3-O-phosphotransferase